MQNNKSKKVKIVAITGGIGSGKSFALRALKNAGFYTLSCDDIVANLYTKRSFLREIKKIFPLAVSGVFNLKVDKKVIAKEVFSNKEKLEKLNKLSHRKVLKIALKNCKKFGKEKGLAFLEVPLLFESNFQNEFDGVIVIKRNIEDRIKSVMERSNLDREEIESRINAQIDYETFDFSKCIVIENNGDISGFENKVLNAINKFLI